MQSPGHPSQVKSSQKKMHPSQTRAEEGLPRRADSPWLTGARQPPGAAGHGVVDVDCPVCLGVLKAGEGVVTFHILECGHRCAAPPFTCTAFPTTASMPAVPVPLSPPPPHHVRFPAACASQDPRRMLAHGQGDGDCIGCRAHVPALSRRVALHAHVCAQGRIGVMLRRSCT